MAKMEIELTEDQIEKVKQLEAHGIGIGDAVDKLFEMREKALPEIESIDNEMSILEKVKETALDIDSKAENLEENYVQAEKTYEIKVQDVKHKVSWARDFFNF